MFSCLSHKENTVREYHSMMALAWSGFHSRSDQASKWPNGESFPFQDTSKFASF